MGGQTTRQRGRLRPGRIIAQVMVFLLLGAILNVAVAWGISIRVDPLASEPIGGWYWLDEGYRIGQRYRTGGTLAYWWGSSAGMDVWETPPSITVVEFLPSWGKDAEDEEFKRNVVIAYGWPFLALWCHQAGWHTTTPDFQAHGGIQLEGHYTGFSDRPCALPLRPIWPGFIVNTLFHAIILWLLIPGPFVLRRLIRIKRGRCPKCGYDLRGAPSGGGCSECGWNRASEGAVSREAV